MSAQPSIDGVGWSFTTDGAHDLGAALEHFLGSLDARPQLLTLGEPMHQEEEFPRLRNQVFKQLVEHEGYRSIAIESDCLAALTMNDFVTKDGGSLDEVMERGFSHGFGGLEENRQLVNWMREYNRGREAAEEVRFYGFDAPTEISGAASPRQALTALHGYLASHLEATLLPCTLETINDLIGDDERWTNPEAAMDPSQSIGAFPEAKELRLVTDDLVAALTSESPGLIAATSHDEWWLACLYGRTAAGLLRYHAKMADGSGSRAALMSRLLAQRAAMMVENLKAIAAAETQRGPTLVFAHNSHLKKDLSKLELPTEWAGPEGETMVSWWSAGALSAAQVGDQYAFLASALGSAADQGLDAPKSDTLEGTLSTIAESRCIFNSRRLAETLRGMGVKLTPRTDTSTNYSALDPDRLGGTDGVVFIKDIPSGSNRTRTGDANDASPQEEV